MPQETAKVYSFRMTPLRLARLKAQSAVRNLKVTTLLNMALEEFFDNHPLSPEEQTAYEVLLTNYREEMK